MGNSTLKAALLDRLHEQADDRATAYILAQSPTTPLSGLTLTVRDVREGFTFTPYELRTLYANGVCTQASMLVQSPRDTKER